jgi:hypothetical protein
MYTAIAQTGSGWARGTADITWGIAVVKAVLDGSWVRGRAYIIWGIAVVSIFFF